MADWTPTMVEDRLESAADVFRSLPEIKPQGYFNAWPEYFHSFADQVGQEPRMRRPRPSPRQITEAEEAMLWLRCLEKDDARIVWLRANRTPWKKIGWEIGLSRPAANRHWQYGIALITWRLNGRVPSRKRSKRFVIENADRLSRQIVM
ncbi:DUF6362 family protein [Paracoccus contaminans]|uniref:DUF6362 domain-containing protein n=1 Tax=Paracoccus contaminans TaxID=1945662 RepID=A0A1W6CZR8_9RHOB|nr:DUF6362 family protein [Paracoccus contaminans]ARJ70374.1 hypothetical protein B0A89_12790 [Paracoccus contaminans]